MEDYTLVYEEWEAEKITDGEALDYFLDLIENQEDGDPLLAKYVSDSDGDQLTDYDAVKLINFRLDLFKKGFFR